MLLRFAYRQHIQIPILVYLPKWVVKELGVIRTKRRAARNGHMGIGRNHRWRPTSVLHRRRREGTHSNRRVRVGLLGNGVLGGFGGRFLGLKIVGYIVLQRLILFQIQRRFCIRVINWFWYSGDTMGKFTLFNNLVLFQFLIRRGTCFSSRWACNVVGVGCNCNWEWVADQLLTGWQASRSPGAGARSGARAVLEDVMNVWS